MTIKNLHVFDFDSTLFRSAEKPDWWDHGWWSKPESLGPPCVPEQPGPEWWVASTVDAARKSIADPETFAVLITGRIRDKFHKRLHTLLNGIGLRFDEVYLTTGGAGTLPFKLAVIVGLIRKLGVEHVEVWEDRSEHVGAFKSIIEAEGKESEIHLVSSKPHPLECTAETFAQRVVARYLVATSG